MPPAERESAARALFALGVVPMNFLVVYLVINAEPPAEPVRYVLS